MLSKKNSSHKNIFFHFHHPQRDNFFHHAIKNNEFTLKGMDNFFIKKFPTLNASVNATLTFLPYLLMSSKVITGNHFQMF